MDVKSQLKNAQFEHFPEASLPTVGTKGRVIVVEETSKVLVDDGVIWKSVSSAAIGDVKQSFLTEAQFITENGATWILADGRDITGSDYAGVIGNNTAPDCRAMFLRSGNLGRADGFVDPNGNQSTNTEISDKTALNGIGISMSGSGGHGHSISTIAPGIFSDPNLTGFVDSTATLNNAKAGTTMSTTGVSDHTHTLSISGDNETAPNHIIVNTFIKINR